MTYKRFGKVNGLKVYLMDKVKAPKGEVAIQCMKTGNTGFINIKNIKNIKKYKW